MNYHPAHAFGEECRSFHVAARWCARRKADGMAARVNTGAVMTGGKVFCSETLGRWIAWRWPRLFRTPKGGVSVLLDSRKRGFEPSSTWVQFALM